MHEGTTGGACAGFVQRGVTNIDRRAQAVALHHQTDIFSLGKPGSALALKILKQRPQAGPCQKTLNVAVLAVAHNEKRRLRGQGGQHLRHTGVKRAAMLRKVAAFVRQAGVAHFQRRCAIAGEQAPGDF